MAKRFANPKCSTLQIDLPPVFGATNMLGKEVKLCTEKIADLIVNINAIKGGCHGCN